MVERRVVPQAISRKPSGVATSRDIIQSACTSCEEERIQEAEHRFADRNVANHLAARRGSRKQG